MRKYLVIGAVILAALCVTSMAQEEGPSGVGFGIKVGTPGVGVEVSIPFTTNIGGRLGVNYYTYSYDTTQEGIEYDSDLTLFSIAGLVDWHPAGGSFRLTGGLLYNGNELEGKAKGDIKIGDNEYTDAEVKAKVDFDDLAPYVGIGWDTSFGSERQWGFICDIGVIYHGTPSVSLKAEGTGPALETDIEKEEDELKAAVDDYVWYPVITVGLIYKF